MGTSTPITHLLCTLHKQNTGGSHHQQRNGHHSHTPVGAHTKAAAIQEWPQTPYPASYVTLRGRHMTHGMDTKPTTWIMPAHLREATKAPEWTPPPHPFSCPAHLHRLLRRETVNGMGYIPCPYPLIVLGRTLGTLLNPRHGHQPHMSDRALTPPRSRKRVARRMDTDPTPSC